MKQLTDLERDIVKMRYVDILYSKEIADKLNLTVHQVKYRLRKPSVKQYIRDVVLPQLLKPVLEQIEARLADPIDSYVMQLLDNFDAKTYIWIGGKKHYYDDNRKQIQALKKIGRIIGINHDQKNIERDLRKAVAKHVAWLKEMKRRTETSLETGEIRFY